MKKIYKSIILSCFAIGSFSLFAMEDKDNLNLALFEAIASKSYNLKDTIKELIKKGADPQAVLAFDEFRAHSHKTKKTPLKCAWLCKRVDIFQCLIECGASPFQEPIPYSYSPGEIILTSRDPMFRNIVLQYLAEKAGTKNRNKALRAMVRLGYTEVAREILSIIPTDKKRRLAVNRLSDDDGQTLLHLALEKYLSKNKDQKYVGTMQLLINYGADIDKPNEKGVTPAQIVQQQAPELQNLFSKEATGELASALQ